MACVAVTPVADMQQTLRITEIFYSLQGEARTVGLPTVFVRLTGCPLRCQYCDSAYAFSGGEIRSLDSILETVAGYRPRYVCVTGGEPLAQPNCLPLLQRLCDAGYSVSLETSGALDISATDRRVSRVLDLKTPGSGEVRRNRYENIAELTGTSYFWNSAINGQHLGGLNFLELSQDTSHIPLIGDKEGFHPYLPNKVNILYADGHATKELIFKTDR